MPIRREFAAALAASGLPERAVIRTGPLPQALMPALYRAADALVFPSVKEGFGLVVLEAMASGVPVVTSRIAPFTEYLGDGDVAVVRSARRRLDRSRHGGGAGTAGRAPS